MVAVVRETGEGPPPDDELAAALIAPSAPDSAEGAQKKH
jgi:hypothetical protein